jgi:Rrf2 family iron-sulfur cluster assembly transcriptional regulator
MFKLYSKGCQYAILALTDVCIREEGERFQAKDVCERLDIPEFFTRKIFQALVQGGFLLAHRGPGGGYSLSRPPSEISILEVIHAVEGEDTFEHCIMGFPECNAKAPCSLHHLWASAKQSLVAKLGESTLQDVTDARLRRDRAQRKKAE